MVHIAPMGLVAISTAIPMTAPAVNLPFERDLVLVVTIVPMAPMVPVVPRIPLLSLWLFPPLKVIRPLWFTLAIPMDVHMAAPEGIPPL